MFSADAWIALLWLTVMEIVLGIDNVIFIAIIAARLPREQQAKARQLGLIVALGTRLLLLLLLVYMTQLDKVVLLDLTWLGVPEAWFHEHEEIRYFTVKDAVLLIGGLFLIGKSTLEIHHKLEGEEEHNQNGQAGSTFVGVIVTISLVDIVFSLDSVITAVGMARPEQLWVMITAMVLSMFAMLRFAGPINYFVSRHPTVKMLALAFLILIGVMLVMDGLGEKIPKGYIYFAMAFSFIVEMLNLRLRSKTEAVRLHEKQMPATD